MSSGPSSPGPPESSSGHSGRPGGRPRPWTGWRWADAAFRSGPRVVRVLAPNPGPMTLEGTNTWIVGTGPALVVDPGPDDEAHLAAVLREAGSIAAVLVTHGHPDHAPGAAALAAAAGAPVFAARGLPGWERLRDGREVEGGDAILRAVATPGHTADHMALFEPTLAALFTGDAVLGRGTSVIDPPEGDLGLYLRSLRAMWALGPRVIYPGHGPVVWDAGAKLEEYLAHRALRERQVLDALAAGPRTPEEIVAEVYTDVSALLHPLAARSVLAHLMKLEAEGRVARLGRPPLARFELATPAVCVRCGAPALPRSSYCHRHSLEVLQEGPSVGASPPPARSRGPESRPGGSVEGGHDTSLTT